MTHDRVAALHLIGAIGAGLFVLSLFCHNLARSRVDPEKLSKWSGLDRQFHAFWFSEDLLKKEGLLSARIRNWAFGLGLVAIAAAGMLPEYAWTR